MTRRLKRHRDFEVSLQIKNEEFIRPPRDSQRNWLLNKALGEFCDDLEELDKLSRRFVSGTDEIPLHDRSRETLKDEEIMENWQIPLMEEMAKIVGETHGDILEIGFGRGISSTAIQNCGVRTHTIVECNDSIVDKFYNWKEDYPGSEIQLIHGKWQDIVDQFEVYDGIFFHTYPLNEDDIMEHIVRSVTYAAHFFPTASKHLRSGGVFTYQTNEIDSLSRAHQRLVFKYFTSLSLKIVDTFELPKNLRDAWWINSMAVVKAVK